MILSIRRHDDALAALQAEIDSLSDEIDTKTAAARNQLLIYRELKQQTENALDEVSSEYYQAQTLFQQGDALFDKLLDIKAEHVRLSKLAVKQADIEAVQKLRLTRTRLRTIYEEINKLKAEAVPAELAESSATRG